MNETEDTREHLQKFAQTADKIEDLKHLCFKNKAKGIDLSGCKTFPHARHISKGNHSERQKIILGMFKPYGFEFTKLRPAGPHMMILPGILAVVAAALTSAAGESIEDDFCICLTPYDCPDGRLWSDDPLVIAQGGRPPRTPSFDGAGVIDPRIQTCDGIKICCFIYEKGGGDKISTTPRPPVPQSGPPLPQMANLRGCGVRRYPGDNNLGLRISGGSGISEPTFYGEVPWMARILINNEFACGGSLISNQVVLTAAHCVAGRFPDEVAVEVGEWDTSTESEPQKPQRQIAISIVVHPEFNNNNLQNDVALISSWSPFQTSETVDIICTPENLEGLDTNSCLAVGWGKANSSSKFTYQPVLRKVQLPYIDRKTCQAKLRSTRLGQHFTLLQGFLCAGGVINGDTCKGDGGGPLYCPLRNERNRLAVVGITAWGIDCGTGNPAVFASVPHYAPWINQQLSNQAAGSPTIKIRAHDSKLPAEKTILK